MNDDIRWKERYEHFKKAMAKLDEAVKMEEYTEIEREGMIQRFEYTVELAWKTLQDLLIARGNEGFKGTFDVIQKGFEVGLVIDNDAWVDMLKKRNLTSHTYNESTAIEVAENIRKKYYFLLDNLDKKFAEEAGK
jgi:nucleotidyltransferase substrate binding protein (TIGR01987 family)